MISKSISFSGLTLDIFPCSPPALKDQAEQPSDFSAWASSDFSSSSTFSSCDPVLPSRVSCHSMLLVSEDLSTHLCSPSRHHLCEDHPLATAQPVSFSTPTCNTRSIPYSFTFSPDQAKTPCNGPQPPQEGGNRQYHPRDFIFYCFDWNKVGSSSPKHCHFALIFFFGSWHTQGNSVIFCHCAYAIYHSTIIFDRKGFVFI